MHPMATPRFPREPDRDTVPAEAWDRTHPDHDWWVEESGRCLADDCPKHPAAADRGDDDR